MIEHYFKLAWRQLVKYRLQSLVSIVSLAIGFACFTMAAMWIKYETTYDAFHKDADGIYELLEYKQEMLSYLGKEDIEQWPEVAEFALYGQSYCEEVNGQKVEVYERLVFDSCFLSIFHLNFLEGGADFLHDEGQVAISDQLAKKLYGEESPIGKELTLDTSIQSQQRRIVTGVFKSWGEHTNSPFELMSKYPSVIPSNHYFTQYCVMRLHPNVNVDTLNARLADYRKPTGAFIRKNEELYPYEVKTSAKVVPITKLRHSTDQYESSAKLKIEHIYLFACAGLLLIACGLLNYLTMFINRLFIRQREMALRTVFGATGGNLMVQFLVEYGMLLLIAMYFGRLTLESSLEWFRTMAELPTDIGYIYRETWLFMSIVMVVSLLVSVPAIWYFRRQSLQSSITGVGGLTRYNTFRRISTGFQMGIAIFCIFCVVVMMKQLDSLRHEDIGFKRENIGYKYVVSTSEEIEALTYFLKQQPEVDTVIVPTHSIYPISSYGMSEISPEENPRLNEPIAYSQMRINEATANFYGMTLLQGEWPDPYKHGPWSVVVNESFARQLGYENLEELIGKEVEGIQVVVGVFKDIMNRAPTQKAEAWMLQAEDTRKEDGTGAYWRRHILFKFKPGTFPILKQKIEDLYKQQGWNDSGDLSTLEATYEELLESEKNLQKLLTITSLVCILIALFGVWSMIMLTCEQRRKEIAIRKVFGATVKDILDMFFLEYMTLQGVAALVAFPLGYACMKPWLEQYVVQTEISWWIYVGIFMAVALLVALCIGWRVWKTATARPADEICKG